MIYDSLDNLCQYRGLSKNLDAAIDFLASADLFALPEGKHQWIPETVYAVVSQIKTKPGEDPVLEAHRDYLDIQIDLAGTERIGVTALGDPRLTRRQPYDKDGDCELFSGPVSAGCAMGPGRFMILFPQDAHAPGLADGAPGMVKKAVIKVKLENT